VGQAVTSPRGSVTPAGQPYTFTYSRFFAPADWTIDFFEYSEAADPVKAPAAFEKSLTGRPIKTIKSDRIDFLSGGVLEEGVPRDRFAFVGRGTVNLPPGDYTIEVISDDGARVWVDGELRLDAWAPHESRVDRVDIQGGRRILKVEYYESAGWAEIRVDIQPRRTRK
jgi:PA14 domain